MTSMILKSTDNYTPVTFLEWVIEMLQDDTLSTVDKVVAVAGVAFQDGHNNFLMERCGIKRTSFMNSKRKLVKNGWIKVTGLGGRGASSKIEGVSPDGMICDLETVSPDDIKAASNMVKKGCQEQVKEPQNKGSKRVSETVSKRVSQTVSSGDTVKRVSPPKDIYQTPPFPKKTPQTPTGGGRNFWSEVLSSDTHDDGVRFDQNTGQVILVNGTRQEWVETFGGEENLRLVLVEISGKIQPNSGRSVGVQVLSHLARIARDERVRRENYQSAVQRNRTRQEKLTPPKETPEEYKARIAKEYQIELQD